MSNAGMGESITNSYAEKEGKKGSVRPFEGEKGNKVLLSTDEKSRTGKGNAGQKLKEKRDAGENQSVKKENSVR